VIEVEERFNFICEIVSFLKAITPFPSADSKKVCPFTLRQVNPK